MMKDEKLKMKDELRFSKITLTAYIYIYIAHYQ